MNPEWQSSEVDKNENLPRLAKSNNYEGKSDFERYVVQKFLHLDIKISNIAKQQNWILNKLSHAVSLQLEEEQDEKIDVFQDLPLKNRDQLQTMENKLNNERYRNKMISISISILNFFL
ncbi:PREDICTED: uncharacterized protein LOC105460418 [Wasmannia auropunctata]|uniref:uncharacterized protein LOC105460418 n=1 Tax=Wasmannia auropunctata TaxID=64793 RepID=UPI0005F04140|nr:PREDICTED: uncharacterized protein LOC105460418 [Wasmannia auropunctata]